VQNNPAGIAAVILGGAGVVILLAGVFRILPIAANALVLMALACFTIAVVIKRIGKNYCS